MISCQWVNYKHYKFQQNESYISPFVTFKHIPHHFAMCVHPFCFPRYCLHVCIGYKLVVIWYFHDLYCFMQTDLKIIEWPFFRFIWYEMNDKYRYGALSTSAISSMHPKVPARISNVRGHFYKIWIFFRRKALNKRYRNHLWNFK